MEDVEKGGILSYIGIPNDRVFVFLLGVIAAIILLLVIVKQYRKNKYRKKLELRAQLNRNVRRREWDKEKNPFD